jgi:curved DNA-binding protein CbpA
MRTCQATRTFEASGTRDIALDGAIGCDNYSRSMTVEYDPMTDHYVALGVGSTASHDEIKKAHRALIRELHPDCGGDAMPAAQVNIARDVLLNPVTREEYNRVRREWHEQHLLASALTEAGSQIYRERAASADDTARRAWRDVFARAHESTRDAKAAQAGSSTSADHPEHAAGTKPQPGQGEPSGSDATEWQPYLAKALLAGRFFRNAEDRRSFTAVVAIGAANLLDNIIKNRVGDNPALREVVDMLSHAIWSEHVRVSKAMAEQRTAAPAARSSVIPKRKKARDGSSKAARSVRSSRTAASQQNHDQDRAPSRRRRGQDGVRRSSSGPR